MITAIQFIIKKQKIIGGPERPRKTAPQSLRFSPIVLIIVQCRHGGVNTLGYLIITLCVIFFQKCFFALCTFIRDCAFIIFHKKPNRASCAVIKSVK